MLPREPGSGKMIVNDDDRSSEGVLRWLLNLPAAPRLVVLALWGLWWIYFTIGAYIESLRNPEQVWWLNIWDGSLGGNSFSAFGATALSLYLTSEVIIMILTLLGNRRRILDAAKKAAAETAAKAAAETAVETAKARLEGVEVGRREERREIRQQMADWYEYAKAEIAAGRDPGPPPIFEENGNQPS